MMTEGGLAFSMYGFESLLVLYVVNHLLKPDVLPHVWGMSAFLPFVQALYNAHTPNALAAAITGLFLALIYVTPMLGGLLADWRLGRTRMVLIGGFLLIAGLICLAIDQTFLIALALLLLGLGCTRGILPAQVGALYAGDDPRRADAYQLFVLGIQVSVIVSPALCSTVAQNIGWHAGFLTAGIGMLVGLCFYFIGRRHLPTDTIAGHTHKKVRLTATEKRTLLILFAILPLLAVATISNTDIFNGYLIWADRYYQLTFLGYNMPASWLVSMDGFVSTFTVLGIVAFWRVWNRYRSDPGEMSKIIIGSMICTIAPSILALGAWIQPGPHHISLAWGIAFHLVNDVGFGLCYATGMALFSRAAPQAVNSTVVAAYSLHLFLGNLLVGKIAGLLGSLSSPVFWLLHVVLAMAATTLLWLFARVFRRELSRQA
ncbi:peptide transporter [Neoasaia chiangmaiensis]|uniref:Peptide transporter n=1 Tax=Neoasaia chiangmaiensis TaxID=320497 RepID=A0A1U9KU09_9PROT|nr:peptide transporter [Neoasaia chiangmaiensis]